MDLALPADLVTGRWTVQLGLPGENETIGPVIGSTTFLIEEFLPDRIKVAVALGDAQRNGERLSADGPAAVAVRADYLFGQPAAGLAAELRATIDPAHFAPAQWRGWVFGDEGRVIDPKTTAPARPAWVDRPETVTLDQHGRAEWQLDLAQLKPSGPTTRPSDADTFRGPWRLAVSAGVSEAGGRAVTGWGEAQVDALPWYIGLRSPGSMVLTGTQVSMPVALVRPDGTPAEEDAELRATCFRVEWNTVLLRRDRGYTFESHRILHPLEYAADLPVAVRGGRGEAMLKIRAGGEYILRVRDPRTGAMSSIAFYAGRESWEGTINRETPERLELVLLDPEAGSVFGVQGSGQADGEEPRFHSLFTGNWQLATGNSLATRNSQLPPFAPATGLGCSSAAPLPGGCC